MHLDFGFVLAIPLCFSAALYGEAVVRGSVSDGQGRAVEGASLKLFRAGATDSVSGVTKADGKFSFAAEAGSEYLLEVAASGFRSVSQRVKADQAIRVTMQLAGIDQKVIVTAEGAAQSVDQVSKALSVIDAVEISQRNEYSLSEVLRDTPGLLVRNLGGPGQSTSIRMRGLRADATSVLVDGMRFRDVATTQGDASSFVSTLNVVNVDRVEVLRGSGSSLYGSNAVGGTVNVVSAAGGGAPHGMVQAEGGSLGLMRGRASVAGGVLDNRLGYSLGLLHLNVLSGVDGDDRARSSGVHGFVRYAIAPRTSVAGRVLFSDDFVQPNLSPTSSGLPVANFGTGTIVPAIPLAWDQVLRSAAGLPITPGNATFIPNRNDPDNRRASRFWSGALLFRQSFSSRLEWASNYQRVHTNRVFMNGPAGAGTQPAVSNFSQFRGDVDTFDNKLLWRPAETYALTGGYEFEREDYLNVDDNRLPAPRTVSTRTRAGQRSHAAYFAQQVSLLQQRLQVSVSGRWQSFSLRQPQFVYSGTADPYGGIPVQTVPKALTGDVAVSYFVAATGTKLRAHGGNSYRAPALYERYGSGFFYDATSNAVVFSPYGDPRLSPDRYNSVDGGIDQYLFGDRVRLSGTYFYTRIVRIAQFDSAGNVVRPGSDLFGRTSGYFNGAGGISRGLEFTAEARPWRGTVLRGSYSYVNADTDQDTAVRGFFRALSVPAHTFVAFFHQQLGRKTDVTADLYHSSDYYNSLSAGGRARAYLYGGVTKLDLVMNRQLWSGEKYRLRGYAKVDNVFNQRYFENGFQAPRATFLTGLQVQFQ